ncbi:cell wall hydrolase [Eisenbergiella sp.]
MAAVAFKGRQVREIPEESRYKTTEELQAEYRQQEAVVEQKDSPRVTESEPDDFEEWVKPQVEGMVPVYGRESIDYISDEDFDLMAKTVYAEAKTEEFEGQVAVAEVILNRVESDNYPNTVKDVITQPGAFSSWSSGAIGDAPFDDECCEAVQAALNERVFPVTVVWFREGHFHPFGKQYTVIGHHYFSSEEEKNES